MEQNKIENIEDVEEVISELTEELLDLLEKIRNSCINNSMSAIRVKRVNDYTKTSYPEIQAEFEEKFPKTYKLNGFRNHINVFQKILSDLLCKNIDTTYYMNLSDDKTIYSIWFSNALLDLLNGKMDLEQCKNALFLAAHEIDPKDFYNLNQSGILSLCEMSERGVDISSYSSAGSLKVNFLNDLANGNFKNKMQEALKKEQIIDCIETSLKEFSMEEIKYNDEFSLYFDSDIDSVSVFSSKDPNPMAIINEKGEFIKGSLNIILVNVYKNINNKNTEVPNNKNSIDNLINKYNEVSTAQTTNQPDLAAALKMALEMLDNNSSSNTSNNAN